METIKKIEEIASQAETIDREFSLVMGLPRGEHSTHKFIRGMMNPKSLMLWDLALFWEGEAIRCEQAGGYFSAMLSSVSMNEALLSFACLLYESEVLNTKEYTTATQNSPGEPLDAVLGRWTLRHLTGVARELCWFPLALVDSNTRDALITVLEEIDHEKIVDEFTPASKKSMEDLLADPGLAMLELTQSIRNYVHPNRWLKRQAKLHETSLNQWCQMASGYQWKHGLPC